MRASFFIAGLIVLFDQMTKYLADRFISPADAVRVLPFIQLVNVKNTGAAFGLMKGMGNFFFISVSVAAIIFIAYMLFKGRAWRLPFSLILGGAAGNLIDRVMFGYVRDFIDVFAGTLHWPAFNVADSALSIGLVLILFGEVFWKRKPR